MRRFPAKAGGSRAIWKRRNSAMMSNLERLVYMANQIARNFETLGHDAAAKATAEHIASFWDPRMKALIFAYLEGDGAGLSATGRAAIEFLHGMVAPPS